MLRKLLIATLAGLLPSIAMANDEAKTDMQELIETVFGSAGDNTKQLIDSAEFMNFGNLIFVSMDYDDDRNITFEEFKAFDFGYKVIAEDAEKTPSYLTAQRVIFSFWDKNGNDGITWSEWHDAMKLDFRRTDQDNSSLLSLDEFSNFYIVNQAYKAALREPTSGPAADSEDFIAAKVCSPESELRNKSLIQSFIQQGQSKRDLQIVGEYLGERFTDHSAAPHSNQGSPREQALAFHEALFTAFPDFRVEIHQQIAECDKVVTYKTFHGTLESDLFGFPATNKPMQIDVIDILRVENGEVIDHWVVNNMVGRLITATKRSD